MRTFQVCPADLHSEHGQDEFRAGRSGLVVFAHNAEVYVVVDYEIDDRRHAYERQKPYRAVKVVILESEPSAGDRLNCGEQKKAGDDKEQIDEKSPVKVTAVEVYAVVDEDVIDLLIMMHDQYDRGHESQEINCSVSARRQSGPAVRSHSVTFPIMQITPALPSKIILSRIRTPEKPHKTT